MGQWITSPDGVRWFLDSGSLALDLGYTGDFGYGVPEWEHLHTPADLGAWLTDRFGILAEEPTAGELTSALGLRGVVSSIALSVADNRPVAAADVDALNAAARNPLHAPHLDGGTTEAPRPRVSELLPAIAWDAIATFGTGASRVRRCAADDCSIVFYDSSRPGARRWCSMQRCGNRTKTRTHRSRVQGGNA